MREGLRTPGVMSGMNSAIVRASIASAPDGGPRRLYTATLAFFDDGAEVTMVHACRVSSTTEIADRLAIRVGPTLAAASTVRLGIDPLDPIVADLLGRKTARHLADRGDLPGGALSGGGDLHVVQRRG